MANYDLAALGAQPSQNCALLLQRAIDDASAAGGGRVTVPAGRWLCGSIRLRSHVELYLAQGARLVCSDDPAHLSDFGSDARDDNADTGWDGGCFISACHAEDITIAGPGTIDGQGCLYVVEDGADGGQGECPLRPVRSRPRLTLLEDVRGLTVRDVTFEDAVFWTLHMAGCRDVRIQNIRILNNERIPNNDGIDPDCCQNVTISGCIIRTADDAIVVKATRPMAEKYGACEHITITGCVLASHDSALKIGTETWGDIRDIVLADSVVDRCSRAVGIWVRDGGTVERVTVHHLTGSTRRYADAEQGRLCRWWGVGESVFLSATPRAGVQRFPGRIRDVSIDHLNLTTEAGIFLAAEADCPLQNIRITDCFLRMQRQGTQPGGLFDEQPSVRDVYAHAVPGLYARAVQGLLLRDVAMVRGTPCGTPWGKPMELQDCTGVQGSCTVRDWETL